MKDGPRPVSSSAEPLTQKRYKSIESIAKSIERTVVACGTQCGWDFTCDCTSKIKWFRKKFAITHAIVASSNTRLSLSRNTHHHHTCTRTCVRVR